MRTFPMIALLSSSLFAAVLLLSQPASADIPPTPPPPPPAALDYVLDPGNSEIYAQVFKDANTIASGLSHDHIVVASGWNGTVTWNAGDPGQCKVAINVPVSGLDNDDPTWRKKMNFNSELSESQRAEVKEHMLSATQMDVSKFGTMSFTSSGCKPEGDKVMVSGTLSIHGVGKAVSLPMKISATDTEFSGSGILTINHTDFGITPFSAMGGALKNRNDIRIVVKTKGKVK